MSNLFTHLLPFARMLKAVRSVERLPVAFFLIILNNHIRNVKNSSTDRSDYNEDAAHGDDNGGWKYIISSVRSEFHIDPRKWSALVRLSKSFGNCLSQSHSLYAVQGPPGTSKPKLFGSLVGFILNYEFVGHVNMPKLNILEHEDGKTRCSANTNALRILIGCASNRATYKALPCLRDGGIPDGRGGCITPLMIRIARQIYD